MDNTTLEAETEEPSISVTENNSSSETDDERESGWQVYRSRRSSPRNKFLEIPGTDSVPTSGTDLTSEGGDSDVERSPLTPKLTLSILKLLEKALSNDALARDLFLLKHIRRHREGFVSLKLLSTYKQVQRLDCNWRTLSKVAKLSRMLELDENGKKVRRKKPLPQNLLEAPTSRTMVVVDIRNDLNSMQKLAVAFGKYGELLSLQLLRPKRSGGIPFELQLISFEVPKVAKTTCAVIKFEDVRVAYKIMKEFQHPHTSIHSMNQGKKCINEYSSKLLKDLCDSCKEKNEMKREKRLEWKLKIEQELKGRESTGSEPEELEKTTRSPYRRSNLTYSDSLSSSRKCKVVPANLSRYPTGPDGTKGFARRAIMMNVI